MLTPELTAFFHVRQYGRGRYLMDELFERAWQHSDRWEIMGRRARAHIERCDQSGPVNRFASAIEHVVLAAFTSKQEEMVCREESTPMG